MFKWIHALKQIKPPVLSHALIETIQKSAQNLYGEPDTLLHRPLSAELLTAWQHALTTFHQSLTKPRLLHLPEDRSILIAQLKTLLHTLNLLENLHLEEWPVTEPAFDLNTFNKQISDPPTEPEPVFQSKTPDLSAIQTFPDFSLATLNPAFSDLLGIENEEKLPVAWLEWVHPEDRVNTFAALGNLLDEKQNSVEYENRLQISSTSSKPVYKQVRWQLVRQGNYVYVSGTRLISQKSQEQENTAVLFHELRNPLNGILGNANLMLSTMEGLITSIKKHGTASEMQLNLTVLYQSLQELKKKLIAIEQCSKDQMTILNHVLDFNKLEQKKIELEIKPFALLRDVVNPLLAIYSAPSKEKNILFLPSIPSVEQRLKGDAHRIKQILTNLLSNAFKFAQPMMEKTATVELSLSLQKANDGNQQLHFIIKNSGEGLSPLQISQLFKAYNQSDPTITRRFGGTGLGLVVCKQLLELMNGDILCSSSLREWVQFDVTLLLPSVQKLTRPKGKRKRPQLKIRPSLNIKVLLAEDNEINQKIMIEMLQKFQCTVYVANDGQQAVELYLNHRLEIGVILMDIQMPKLTGLEATRKIRDLEKTNSWLPTPIIGLSGDAFIEQKNQAFDVGMDTYITKPVQLEQLCEALTPYRVVTTKELKSGSISPGLSLFIPRTASSNPASASSNGSFELKQEDISSPPSGRAEKSQAFPDDIEIKSLRTRVTKLELMLQPLSILPEKSTQLSREADDDNTPPLTDFKQLGSPKHSFPMTQWLAGSFSAPLLTNPPAPLDSSLTKYSHIPELTLFNQSNNQNTEMKVTPMQQTKNMLQHIGYYFRAALTERDFPSHDQLEIWIKRLDHCYKTASLSHRGLIAATTLGYWQSLYNQAAEMPVINSGKSALLQRAALQVESWQLQIDLFEKTQQSAQHRSSDCCIIS